MPFSKLPKSFVWFGLTGLIYLLQVIPWTGIFLMFALAPLWSIVTVNVGFLSLAFEALTRRTHIAWLALPVLWFGGYAVLANLSHSAVARVEADVRLANARVDIEFDPQRQALVLNSSPDVLSGTAGKLVRSYDLPVAYEAKGKSQTPYRAYRLGSQDLCTTISSDPSYGAAGVRGNLARENRKAVRGLCAYSGPEAPKLPAVVVTAMKRKDSSFLAPRVLYDITVRGPDGHEQTLVIGRARVLAWLPMPVMGCALNSAAPSWQCDGGFWRTTVSLGSTKAYGGAATVLAKALHLKPLTTSEQVARQAQRDQVLPVEAVAAARAEALAKLDRALANPQDRLQLFDVRVLQHDPNVIVQRFDGIVAAITERLTKNSVQGWETTRVLASLLTGLSDAQFDDAARRLLPLIGPADKWGRDMMPADFTTRLGDLGAEAVPKLAEIAFSGRRRNTAAIFGLCRAGASSQEFADQLFEALRDTKRSDATHQAAFVTLLRLGRKDLVLQDDDSSPHHSKTYRAWAETITPQSPPSECTNAKRRRISKKSDTPPPSP